MKQEDLNCSLAILCREYELGRVKSFELVGGGKEFSGANCQRDFYIFFAGALAEKLEYPRFINTALKLIEQLDKTTDAPLKVAIEKLRKEVEKSLNVN